MPTPWRLLVFVWPVLSVLYTLILVGNAEWPWQQGLILGAITIGVALLLGVPVWHLTGRLPIPDRVDATFLLTHIAAAIVYSMLWIVFDMSAAAVFLPHALHQRKIATMGWETILGVWMYGMIAGASYAARARHIASVVRRSSELAESRAIRAELDALRARLNPHFLFNALHSLGGLARDDLARFDLAVDHLGELLREAIRPTSAALVPLSDDLEFAQRFLAFEGIRLGARLRIEVDVDESAMDAPMPFMILQPIVENAVRHGIDPVPDGGTISIRARVRDRVLHLSVEDDGAGFDPSAPNGHGVGLGALRERLTRIYRDPSLVVEGRPQGGCAVHVRLPV